MKIGRYTYVPSRRAQPSPLSLPSPVPRAPHRKALLIAISDAGPGFGSLAGPHGDVALMRALLVDRYGYKEGDGVVLTDEKDDAVQPTRANILKAIAELVRGARRGDRFFFHYCGHTMQTPNRTNSEEDGMDECLVPADGEPHKITDNELRRALVEPLPVGAALVAVFDSCHSASLLDLAHFRCNRVYVPWVNKGRRRSDERWNSVVRRHAIPLLPLSKPVSRTNTNSRPLSPISPIARPLSPLGPAATANTNTKVSHAKAPPTRRATRRATRELRELVQLMEEARAAGADVPTRPNTPTSPDNSTSPTSASSRTHTHLPTPIVTTRRIYEAARTSKRTLRAWRTDVDRLEVLEDAVEDEVVEAVERAGTEVDAKEKARKDGKLKRGLSVKRASLPLLPVRLGPLREQATEKEKEAERISAKEVTKEKQPKEKEGEGEAKQGKQRRTTVTRARAVSIAVGKENEGVDVTMGRPALTIAVERTGRPVSWLGEEGSAAGRACESPEREWPCQGDCRERGHGHDDATPAEADVISLASCKDYQVSWESTDGGSMTRELVKILEREPHPTLRTLVTRVSHALHRMMLERHRETRKWRHDLKKYQRYHGVDADVEVSPSSPSRTASVAPPSPTRQTAPKTQARMGVGAKVKAKSEGFVDQPMYEMDNFQNPEVASHRPLDMERPWSM